MLKRTVGLGIKSAGNASNKARSIRVPVPKVKALQNKQPAASSPTLSKKKSMSTKGSANFKAPKAKLNSQTHKQSLAQKGENATKSLLRKNGFNRFPSLKYNGIHGVDLAAIRMTKNNRISKAAVIEAKALREKTPGPSTFRKQTSHTYIKNNLLKAKNKGIKHADKLYDMAKNKKLNIYGSGYNLKTGKAKLYKVYEPKLKHNKAVSGPSLKSTQVLQPAITAPKENKLTVKK